MFALGHLGIALGLAWLATSRGVRGVDYRVVLLGSMLPDLIDKPLGAVLGLESRLWGHTLVFLAIFLAASLHPRGRILTWLAFGVGVHLLLDEMWWQPGVVLWPAYGWSFPPGAVDLSGYLDILLHDPYVQAGEVLGTILVVAFFWVHGIRSWPRLRAFLREGRVAEG